MALDDDDDDDDDDDGLWTLFCGLGDSDFGPFFVDSATRTLDPFLWTRRLELWTLFCGLGDSNMWT